MLYVVLLVVIYNLKIVMLRKVMIMMESVPSYLMALQQKVVSILIIINGLPGFGMQEQLLGLHQIVM